jgi:CheY-like chemotaxis protein
VGVQGRIGDDRSCLLPGTRILIVEDNPLVAFTAGAMVDDLGGEVVGIAGTLAEAIALAGRCAAQATMLDIDLRGTSSEAVAATLTARRIPFLVTTGFQTRSLRGFEGAPRLLKPYLPHQLGRALLALLREPVA